MTVRLDLEYRTRALANLATTEFDVLVIGGGVVGAGAALDAASRGLSVALVEARDYAAGTSSKSSKLIHGGLRYLEQRDFGLVREALRERALLLHRLAPHLVQPVPFLYPLRHRAWERAYVGAGVLLYDTIGGARAMPRHRHMSRRHALSVAPSLRRDALTGAVRYYDAQADDARLTMMIARTAAQHGATVLTRAAVTGLREDDGRVTGAVVRAEGMGRRAGRNIESGRTIDVAARRVISAAGVWTDDVHDLAGIKGAFHVQMSKGVHVLVPRSRIDLGTGLIMRTEKSVLFVIPWGRHWIIGTTDTPYDLEKAAPVATPEDVEYLLDHVNAVLREPLTADDVVASYAGLRPLLAAPDGAGTSTTALSREHAVAEPKPGLMVIAGGKYTTYRVMAADVVDAAVRGLGRSVAPSVTNRLPITGAVGYHEMWYDRAEIARSSGLPMTAIERLLRRYGSHTRDLLVLMADRPELAATIPGADPYVMAEAVYAVAAEGAVHLDDILARRTRIAIETADEGAQAAEAVADAVGGYLGWDAEQIAREVSQYRAAIGNLTSQS